MEHQQMAHHPSMSLPHPTALTSIHASLPHFLPSPALASPVGSSSQPSHPLPSNAPCSTLFVANLGQFVSEHELKEIFASFPGFCRLRMHTKGPPITSGFGGSNNSTSTSSSSAASTTSAHGKTTPTAPSLVGSPVAFVEYQDVRCAATAMTSLQGSFLLSSDRGGIRIEYAKSKMAAEVGFTNLNVCQMTGSASANAMNAATWGRMEVGYLLLLKHLVPPQTSFQMKQLCSLRQVKLSDRNGTKTEVNYM